MKTKFIFCVLLIMILLLFAFSYFGKLGTGEYCAESPIVRWKFAIYTGECDDETGCHFTKMQGTGVLEYFGLKRFPCIDNRDLSDQTPLSQDILAIKH